MSAGAVDDWDEHWSGFGWAAARSPALKYRRRLIYSLWKLPKDRPIQVLEIGSGQGEFAADVLRRRLGARFVGLELSQFGVVAASARAPAATFLQRDLRRPVANGDVPAGFAATYAVCSEVLEHADDPVLLLRHAAAYMARGCRLVATVPGGPITAFDRRIGHRRHYAKADLGAVFAAAGYRVESLQAAGFPFFNLYRRLAALRGQALYGDVSGAPAGRPLGPVRLAMLVFDGLFRFNLRRWGSQVAGVAVLAEAPER